MSLLTELRKRRVFRSVAWYAGVAWLAIEVASTVLPQFELPRWTLRALIVLALAGVPAVALLSWVFEFGGADTAPPSASVETATATKAADSALPATTAAWRAPSLWLALAAGALLVIGAQQAWRRLVEPSIDARIGLAVLPIDALGVDANASLAGGLHEAILNELAAFPQLRVIARTSVLRYASKPDDVRQIGRDLDARYVLEGSLQRDGAHQRLTVQLIDTATNDHVWSESYDRESSDLFGLQSALARDVARRLQVSLLPEERARRDVPPTADAAAYEAYLQATERLSRSSYMDVEDRGRSLFLEAGQLLDTALQRDPQFALAHAARARVYTSLVWHFQSDPEFAGAREAALAAALEALRLQPNLPEAHRELGRYYYWGHFDFEKADAALTTALRGLPNDLDTLELLGYLRRRQGRVGECVQLARDMVAIAPNHLVATVNLVHRLTMTQRFVEAGKFAARARERFPDSESVAQVSRDLEFCRTGDVYAWFGRTAPKPGVADAAATLPADLLLLAGRYDEAVSAFQAELAEHADDDNLRVGLAEALRLAGRRDEAAAVAQELLPRVEAARAEHGWERARRDLPYIHALAGHDDDALKLNRQQLAALPAGRLFLENLEALLVAAQTSAVLGRRDEALSYLRRYIATGYGACAASLRADTSFRSLVDDPEFESIVAPRNWRE